MNLMDQESEYGGNRKHAAETAFKEFHQRTIPTDSKLLQPAITEDQLIQPKKLVNPVIQSKNHRSINQEIKINNKLNVNVLGQKSELSRVFLDRKREKNYQNTHQNAPQKSEFEQMIEKRREGIEEIEKKKVEEDNVPEFLKVKKRLGSNKN